MEAEQKEEELCSNFYIAGLNKLKLDLFLSFDSEVVTCLPCSESKVNNAPPLIWQEGGNLMPLYFKVVSAFS